MNTYTPSGSLKPHRGTLLLVFGILGLVCCLIFGILAWVMGQGDLKEMAAGRMDPAGESLTKVAKILGIVSVALNILGILVWGLMMGGLAAMAAAGH